MPEQHASSIALLGRDSFDSTAGAPTASDLDAGASVDDVPDPIETVAVAEETLGRRSSGQEDRLEIQRSPSAITERRGTLTYLNGVALVVSLQIGSGIFFTPSEVSKHVPSAGAGVLVWLVGGLMVWTGVASFIELGRAIPRNGGPQEYLRQCYGEFYGFMFSWVWISVCKPCSVAIVSTIFAKHLNSTFLPESMASSAWIDKVTAVIGLASLTIINCLGTKTGVHAANGFFVLKLLALLSIIITGLVIGVNGQGEGVGKADEPGWFSNQKPQTLADTGVAEQQGHEIWTVFGDYVTAIFAALFSYGGWDIVAYVAGDLENTSRDLPRVLNTAMTIVITGFCLTNIAFYLVLPFSTIRDTGTPAITFGTHVFGTSGGLVYSLIVASSCLGVINANIFATGKLCVAASQRNYLPKIFGDPFSPSREEERNYYKQSLRRYPSSIVTVLLWVADISAYFRWEKDVPVYAILMNTALTSIYILIGSYRSLLTFIGIAEYLFFFFTVLGVFVLRRHTYSGDAVPRTWTINPIAFCLFSGFIVVRGVITDPFQGLAICIVVLFGWIFWHFQGSRETRSREDFLLEQIID